ncbi:hypothetical protein [Streptomyces sp. NPDC051567]|uniref:TRADD-N-associated membrane domain-containing protein n=1 Tax=Streptomyces sp. NPDC051567 TaxID=3365660 RepID=UPI0037A50D34
MAGAGEWLWGVGAAAVLAAGQLVAGRLGADGFERRRAQERDRLLGQLAARTGAVPVPAAPPGPVPGAGPGERDPKYGDAGAARPRTRPAGRYDDFTPVLVEYYAYGLTQARSSFVTSQRFAGAGAMILLFGVGLAVWKAETSGDLYLGIVTSSVGLVVALVGQLFHRRADIALKHMADQTASLRDDRRAAENTRQAVALLDEVGDPVLRSRLQAGLIMKLSGAELPPVAG